MVWHEGERIMNSENISLCEVFSCRENCGACCIAPSITTSLPGMPEGKPAGVFCIHLDENFRCRLYGKEQRPSFCISLKPSLEMCGMSKEEAMAYLTWLELMTLPGGKNKNL